MMLTYNCFLFYTGLTKIANNDTEVVVVLGRTFLHRCFVGGMKDVKTTWKYNEEDIGNNSHTWVFKTNTSLQHIVLLFYELQISHA